MHFTHCILVAVDPSKDPDEMRRKACLEAVTMTEGFRDTVFDWRTEPDDGDPDPPNGVVLGKTDPEQFRKLLTDFSHRPFEVAAYMLGNDEMVINEALIASVWENRGDWRFIDRIKEVKEVLALITGDYAIESQFYSVPNRSASISPETLQNALEHPEKYALAFFDYHL